MIGAGCITLGSIGGCTQRLPLVGGGNPEGTVREFLNAIDSGDIERANELTVRDMSDLQQQSVTINTVEERSFERVFEESYPEGSDIEAQRQQVNQAVNEQGYDEWTFVYYSIELGGTNPTESHALLVRGDRWLILEVG
jgi:hypothetical protein